MTAICLKTLFATALAAILMGVGGLLAHSELPVAEEYVASGSGSVYHLPDCHYAQRIGNNKLHLTKDEAETRGLRPCKDCLRVYERQPLTSPERSRLASGLRP